MSYCSSRNASRSSLSNVSTSKAVDNDGIFSHYLRQGAIVFIAVVVCVCVRARVCVCLSVCVQNNSKSYELILLIFSRKNACVLETNRLGF